jgi:hypothetical protein
VDAGEQNEFNKRMTEDDDDFPLKSLLGRFGYGSEICSSKWNLEGDKKAKNRFIFARFLARSSFTQSISVKDVGAFERSQPFMTLNFRKSFSLVYDDDNSFITKNSPSCSCSSFFLFFLHKIKRFKNHGKDLFSI